MKCIYLVVVGLCLLQGCNKGPTEAADIDRAEPALRTALEAWKSGKSQQVLTEQTPSILMNEDDWREGKKLMDYKMEETGALYGRQVVWWVQIKVEQKGGKVEERRVKYVIDTIPRIVIVRDRFAS